MPKKNGITKTFSFDKDVVSMLDDMCKSERRTQTNLIEMLIVEKYKGIMNNGNRQTAKRN